MQVNSMDHQAAFLSLILYDRWPWCAVIHYPLNNSTQGWYQGTQCLPYDTVYGSIHIVLVAQQKWTVEANETLPPLSSVHLWCRHWKGQFKLSGSRQQYRMWDLDLV